MKPRVVLLTKLGYYHGAVDGLFGRATRDALAHYQTDHPPRRDRNSDNGNAAVTRGTAAGE
jgi:Putative peptidoglycan binding domain